MSKINEGINNEQKEKEKNYIISEINIEEKDLNREIRIINSYEQYKREENYIEEYGVDLNKYNNEETIKDCKIKINDIIIPFNYFHKFTSVGIYKIK